LAASMTRTELSPPKAILLLSGDQLTPYSVS
jgi:hypothetical protein